MTMMPALRRMVQVDWERRVYFLSAVAYLLRSRVALAFVTTKAIIDELGRRSGNRLAPGQRSGRTVKPELVAWAIQAAARRVPWRADCLAQAIAAARWLRRHGHEPIFELGVARSDHGTLRGHAWLTLDGRVIVGGEDRGLEEFVPIPIPRGPDKDG
jgi:hypothetical protein